MLQIVASQQIFEEVEFDLKKVWEADDATVPSWEEARNPARDAFERARGGKAKTRKEDSHGSKP